MSWRHNYIDTSGVIYLTRLLLLSCLASFDDRMSRIRTINDSRSSTRNAARPAEMLTNPSSGATSVQETGRERVRPFGPRYMTLSSPQLKRYVRSSKACPFRGWKGCMTVKTCGRCASRGAIRGLCQRQNRTVSSFVQGNDQPGSLGISRAA